MMRDLVLPNESWHMVVSRGPDRGPRLRVREGLGIAQRQPRE